MDNPKSFKLNEEIGFKSILTARFECMYIKGLESSNRSMQKEKDRLLDKLRRRFEKIVEPTNLSKRADKSTGNDLLKTPTHRDFFHWRNRSSLGIRPEFFAGSI